MKWFIRRVTRWSDQFNGNISNFKQHAHKDTQVENISSVALRIRSGFIRGNIKMDNLNAVSNFTQPSCQSFEFAGVERR